jgi:hypothetical protein
MPRQVDAPGDGKTMRRERTIATTITHLPPLAAADCERVINVTQRLPFPFGFRVSQPRSWPALPPVAAGRWPVAGGRWPGASSAWQHAARLFLAGLRIAAGEGAAGHGAYHVRSTLNVFMLRRAEEIGGGILYARRGVFFEGGRNGLEGAGRPEVPKSQEGRWYAFLAPLVGSWWRPGAWGSP